VAHIGFTLQPERRYLELLEEVYLTEVDYYEVAPETLWWPDSEGRFGPNGFHGMFAELKERTGKPVVAHGVGWSLGSVARDADRRARWKERITEDCKVFDYEWYTDHLGVTQMAGRELTLPMPTVMTDEMAAVVQRNLLELQSVVPDVGIENSVFYFHLGDPLDEPAFLRKILEPARTHMLLDLHNVYTTAVNAGFEPWNYIELLPLERVIEIHLSGGSESEAAWLPSGNVLRLDSHDHGIPEEVWFLYERVVSLCPNLRGVTVERMEGTVDEPDVAILRDELRRARRIAELARV